MQKLFEGAGIKVIPINTMTQEEQNSTMIYAFKTILKTFSLVMKITQKS